MHISQDKWRIAYLTMEKEEDLVPKEAIVRRIILLREEKVMLDVHLAELYKVETRSLKQAVRRNLDRFPADFMFELNDWEIDQVVSQNVIPSKQSLGGAKPFAFTEAGVAMLSSVLNSRMAVDMNIAIIRTFVMLRKLASHYDLVVMRLERMEKTNEDRFKEIYEVLNHLIKPPTEPMRKIGFKQKTS